MQAKHPDGDNLLDFDTALGTLKASLALENNPKYSPPVETEYTFDTYPYWCLSQASRFVWARVAEKQMRLQNNRLVLDEERPFFMAMMYGMSQHELQMFAENIPDERLQRDAEALSNRIYSLKKKPQRNKSVDELIVMFCGRNTEEQAEARVQLWKRFGAQSHVDQVKTVKTLLKGEECDREWCYETMKTWWGDELIPDVQRAWETFHEKECAGIVAKKLPSSYVISHRVELEEKDYASVCLRLCTAKDSFVDDTRLNRAEFVEIIVHNHWEINDNEADELLFGYLLDVLNFNVSYTIDAYKYDSAFSHHDFRRQSERMNYRPTLLFIEAVEEYIVALGKLGKTNTIIKFYRWNKHVQQLLDDYIADFANAENLVEKMKDDFGVYQGRIWETFESLALQNFPFDVNEFWNTHNKYHFSEHDTPYYSGRNWREDLFTWIYQ